MSSYAATPTLARRALGAMLQRLREAAGSERVEVAEEIGIDTETLRRWEIGKSAPKVHAVRTLGAMYHATPQEISRMCSWAVDSRKRGAFEDNNVPPELRILIETELTARSIQSLELEIIPGLLQTPEYLRAAQEAQVPSPAEMARSVRDLRARRQRMVADRTYPPHMEFMIGPAAMMYLDGMPHVRDSQLAKLREADQRPNIDIRIINRLHAGVDGAFTILTPRKSAVGAYPFAYVETIDGGRYIETPDVVSQFQKVFNTVREQAISLEEYLDVH